MALRLYKVLALFNYYKILLVIEKSAVLVKVFSHIMIHDGFKSSVFFFLIV